MSRPLYIGGSDNKAISSDNVYYGVDNKARKVKRMYYGDENGIARLCFKIDEEVNRNPSIQKFDGTIDTDYDEVAAVKFNNKAVYIGGESEDGTFTDRIVTIDHNLTAMIVGQYPYPVSGAGAVSINDEYLAVYGGKKVIGDAVNTSDDVYIYNKDMTLVSSNTDNTQSVFEPSTGSTSNYGLFKYGFVDTDKTSARTDRYCKVDKDLTVTFGDYGTGGTAEVASASGNDRIVFAGGENRAAVTDTNEVLTRSTTVVSFDKDFTKTTLTELFVGARRKAGVYMNGYYIFAGGVYSYINEGDIDFVKTIELYNKDLTKMTNLSFDREKAVAAGATEENAIFAGSLYVDNDTLYYGTEVEVLSKDLTITTFDSPKPFSPKQAVGITLPGKMIFNFSGDNGYEIFDI